MSRSFKFIATILFALLPFTARAQFFLSGTDAAKLKWMSIRSTNFEVIYPIGCDSLARSYLTELEVWRPQVAASLGMAANDGCTKPLPVILHVQNASSNGMVTWTPRRMELNTLPEWGNPTPMPWTTMLSIHEGRHAAQMANGYRKVFKPFYYVFGQIIPGIASGWPGKLFLEGDAVIAETALSQSGRGRSASFLQYYNYAFDNADMRNWMRWRLGSYYHYTPDHYAFGYTILSGIRTRYDAPAFMSDYFDYVSRRPYDPWPFRHVLRKTSGKKFKQSYPEILTANYDAWAADTASRKPFMPVTVVSHPASRLIRYTNPNSAPDGAHLWIKEDLYHIPAFISIGKDGKEKKLFNVSSEIGKMNYEERDSTLLWNEIRRDPRWEQKRKSIVRSYSFSTGKLTKLTKYGSYFYPVEITGTEVAAIHYLETGEEKVEIIDKKNGEPIDAISIPDTLQILEITHIGTDLFAVGISAAGSGIYKCSFSSARPRRWEEVLPPRPFSVNAIDHAEDCIVFESDRTGVNEYYKYDTVSGTLTQLTSGKYGAIDYNLCPDGSISYSLVCSHGSCAAITYAYALPSKVVDWNDYHHYAVADKLSEQEKALAAQRMRTSGERSAVPTFTSSRRYRKMGHGVHLHSWAPLYADIDAVSRFSFDNIKNLAHLGAMVFFQNDMSTFHGWAGYQAKLVENGKGDAGGCWRNAGHLNLTYSGLYPEFSGEFHINEEAAKQFEYNESDGKIYYRDTKNPRIRTSLTVRVPLSWDNGVLQYGVIPSMGVIYTNDKVFGKANILYNASVRAYAVQHIPYAAVYPRWGIGTELTYSETAALAYLYGYIPGMGWGQGIRLSLLAQKRLKENPIYVSSYANIIPRGFNGSYGVLDGFKASVDYTAPFPMGDWHIADAFYCRRGIITPHFDCSWLAGIKYGTLWSAGFTFELEFGSFFWIRTPISVGLTYSYNDGNLYDTLGFTSRDRNFVGATFSISL